MQEEYNSLMPNGTWELTNLLKDRKSVGCEWVFRTNLQISGEIVRCKVGKMIFSSGQSGVNEIFAYVAKFITIRCNLAIEVTMIWDIHQMDVKSTFLNGVLEVKIYMNQ